MCVDRTITNMQTVDRTMYCNCAQVRERERSVTSACFFCVGGGGGGGCVIYGFEWTVQIVLSCNLPVHEIHFVLEPWSFKSLTELRTTTTDNP